MKINNTSVGFSGKLILKNEQLWTNAMLNAINNNPSIQKKLSDNNIVCKISSKVEKKIPAYLSFHSKGDRIYKVNFVVKKEKPSFVDVIKNIFNPKNRKYSLNRHFHSESTVISRIEELKMR